MVIALLLVAVIVSIATCTPDQSIMKGEPIVLRNKLYRCAEKEWPE